MTTAVSILRIADAVLALAFSVGVNLQRYHQMKAENGGAPLTDEQLDELTRGASEKLDRH